MISTVINCAGNGSRFGKNKMLVKIGDEPILVHVVRQFTRVKAIGEIVVTAPKNKINKYQKILDQAGLKAKIIAGGSERAISAYYGVKETKGEIVLIHDGARPFVSVSLIERVINEVKKSGAAMAAVMADTCIKLIEDNWVKDSLPRHKTWLGQTPHGFKRALVLKAYKRAMKKGPLCLADDCELVMRLGEKVKVVPGDESNIKITIPHDLFLARRIWKNLKRGKNV